MTTNPGSAHRVAWRFVAKDPQRLTAWLGATRDDGCRIVDASTRDLLDIYLETEDWRIYRGGYSLRLRCTTTHAPAATQYEAMLEPSRAGAQEFAAPLADAQTTTVRDAGGELGQRVRRLAGRKPLHALCEIRTCRTIYLIEEHGEVLAAVNVDSGIGRDAGQEQRVEVQARPADLDRLQSLVAEMQHEGDLVAAMPSGLEDILAARRLQPISALDLGSTRVDAELPIAAAAYAILRAQFAALWRHEPGTRLGDDIEALHQMRVAVRRLRAALRLFEDVLPPRRRAWMAEELRWLGGALGVVRDLDVQLDFVQARSAMVPENEQSGLEEIAAYLRGRRAGAYEQLLRELDSERYARLIAVGSLTLQRGTVPRTRAARLPVAVSAPRHIADRRRPARKHAARVTPESSPADLHALRIRCKRWRYAVEFFSDVYGKPAKKLARELAAIQDILGIQQDAAVAAAAGAEFTAPAFTSDAVASYVDFVAELKQRAMDERAQLEPRLRVVMGKPWKRLRRAMRRQRDATLAAITDSRHPRRRRPRAAAEEPDSQRSRHLDPAPRATAPLPQDPAIAATLPPPEP